MRKTRTTLLSFLLAGVLAIAGFGGGYAFFRSQVSAANAAEQSTAVPPVEAVTKNLARGKAGEFRSLTDFSQTLDYYAYFPDLNGDAIANSGCYNASNIGNTTAVLTDGIGDKWEKWNAISTAKDVRGWAVVDLGAPYPIERVKVHLLAAWCFTDMIIQVSNDANFESGVTTIMSTVDSLEFNGETVYSGGRKGLSVETKPLTGWNGSLGIDSKQAEGNIFPANNVMARYVRITNNTHGNGSEYSSNTVFTEIEVYGVEKGMPPLASLEAGFHSSLGEVTLSTPYENGKIYYTLDGSYPTTSSTLYSGAIDLSAVEEACVLRAIVVTDEWQSLAADYQYKIGLPAGNLLLNKTVIFKSMTDFSQTLPAYAYMPDGNGDSGAGSGCYNLSWAGGNTARLTDGNTNDWAGFNTLSTAGNTQGWVFADLGKTYPVARVKVHMLAAWCFQNVIVQLSNDPAFEQDVITVFSTVESLEIDGTTVYNGGKQGLTQETKNLTGWNGQIGVDSKMNEGNVFPCDGVSARYVRFTNNNMGNGGSDSNTCLGEIEAYAAAKQIEDIEVEQTVKSASFTAKTVEVPYNTQIEQVREKLNLPAQVNVLDYAGNSHSVALSWTEPEYSATTAGNYEFTAAYSLPENLTDVFGKMPEFKATVTVAEKTDTTELQAALDAASALVEEEYTAASWAVLQTKIDAAQAAVNNLSVTEEEAATALEELNAAIKALARIASSAEKAALKSVIDEAKALDKTLYTSASLNGLEGAIASAEETHSNANASSSQVNAAKDALQKILAAKELKATQAQIEELNAFAQEVKNAGYTTENYTQASVAAVEDALEEAEALSAQAECSANAVTAAKTALEEAVAGLEAYGDASELNALITEAEKHAAADYTASTFDALKSEIEKAESVAAEKHSQSEFDAAKNSLQTAIDSLVSVKELRAAIQNAVPEEGKEYTALSLQVLADAKTEAEIILKKSDATKEEVAAVTQKLNKAFSELALKSDEPADSEPDAKQESKKKGCKSSFGGASVVIAILFVVCAVALIKKKRVRI